MAIINSLFRIYSLAAAMPLAFALLLLAILIISFRSRVYREGGPDAVRSYFLDLIIREDLKHGPIEIPAAEEREVEKVASD